MIKQRFDDFQSCLPMIMGNTVISCLLGFEVVVLMMMVVVVVDLELTDEEVPKNNLRKKMWGKKRLETPTVCRDVQ